MSANPEDQPDERDVVLRCEKCGKYLDGLTDGAEPHPIYFMYCVADGEEAMQDDGGWSASDQARREGRIP